MPNTLSFLDDGLSSERIQQEYARSKRFNLVLGQLVHILPSGQYQLGKIMYHKPSPKGSNIESTYIKGPSGSGKSWLGYGLEGQEYFLGRTIVLIDTKFSVTGDSQIYVRINGVEQSMPIATLVDEYLPGSDLPSQVADLRAMQIETLAVGPDHKVTWRPVVACSKHFSPERILTITTASGRTVSATEGHSFLTLHNGEYSKVKGGDLRVGDPIPVAGQIPMGELASLNVLEYFDPTEIIDCDQILTAIQQCTELNLTPIQAYRAAEIQSVSYSGFFRYYSYHNKDGLIPGHFKLITKNHSKTHVFPKTIELTKDFGFFCGLFIAEGRAVNHYGCRQINITNYTSGLRQRAQQWLQNIGIIWTNCSGKGEENLVGFTITNYPLVRLFAEMFGNGIETNSGDKHLPSWIFNANADFLKGFLDGYMCGDGHVRPAPRYEISFVTKSSQLRIDLNLLFTKFGMPLRFTEQMSKTGVMYTGRIHSSDLPKWRDIGFTDPDKSVRYIKYPRRIPGLDSKHLIDIRYALAGLSWRKEAAVVKNAISKNFVSRSNAIRIATALRNRHPCQWAKLMLMIQGDVWWDEIKSIEIENPITNHVYDLEVDHDHNFFLSNGIHLCNSYIGNNRPNMAYKNELLMAGLRPRGIPAEQIDVIAPRIYAEGLSKEDIKSTWLSDSYRIPLRFCTLPVMFEVAKLNKKAGYASAFEQNFRAVMNRSLGNPKLSDLYDLLEEISTREGMERMGWIYKFMLAKIEEVADSMIDDVNPWSSVGERLFQAVRDNKPRWIVFTLGHAEDPKDDLNLAMLSTILTEINAFAKYCKFHRLPYNLGVYIDELHTFVRTKDASSRNAIHDLLHASGRTNRIRRTFLTQRDEQLDKVFRDDIRNLSNLGTYQCVISCSQIPEAGYITYLNRSRASMTAQSVPLYYPKVKATPPMFDVESDEPDDLHWLNQTILNMKMERARYSSAFPGSDSNAFLYDPTQDLILDQIEKNILAGNPVPEKMRSFYDQARFLA